MGSWLSSWAYYFREQSPHRLNQIAEIENELKEQPRHIDDPPEPRQAQFLRRYSNYLTPRLGA